MMAWRVRWLAKMVLADCMLNRRRRMYEMDGQLESWAGRREGVVGPLKLLSSWCVFFVGGGGEKRKARIAALSMKEEVTAADVEEGESAERLALWVGEMDKVAAAAGDVLVGAPAERRTWR